MNETVNDIDPCFSPEAQQTFVPGARVFIVKHPDTDPITGEEAVLGGAEGTFLGWIGNDQHSPRAAVVEFEHLKNYNLPAVRETGFEYLRNLCR